VKDWPQTTGGDEAERNGTLLRESYIPIHGMLCMQWLPKINQLLNDFSRPLFFGSVCFGKPPERCRAASASWVGLGLRAHRATEEITRSFPFVNRA
jgi:hypothetical protein